MPDTLKCLPVKPELKSLGGFVMDYERFEFEDETFLALHAPDRVISIACRDNVCAVTVRPLGRNRIQAAESFIVEHTRIFVASDTKEEMLIHASI